MLVSFLHGRVAIFFLHDLRKISKNTLFRFKEWKKKRKQKQKLKQTNKQIEEEWFLWYFEKSTDFVQLMY